MNHRSSMINVSPVLEWDTNSIPTLKLISLQFENHVKKKNSCRESASTTSQTGGKSVANTLWLRAVNIVKAVNLSMPDISTKKLIFSQKKLVFSQKNALNRQCSLTVGWKLPDEEEEFCLTRNIHHLFLFAWLFKPKLLFADAMRCLRMSWRDKK